MESKPVVEILEEIEATQGLNAKGAVLGKHASNDLLKEIFRLTSDPYVNFYVAKVPKVNRVGSKKTLGDYHIKLFLQALNRCIHRDFTGNAARDAIASTLVQMNDLEFKWASRILTRKMRTGIGDSGIEKVWPGLLPKFEPALAKEVDWEIVGEKLHLLTPIKYPVRVEPKWDGFRCISVKADGQVTMFARSGRVFERAPTIQKWLEEHMPDGYVFDGELMGEEWNDTAEVLGSRKNHKSDEGLQYHVFDCLPLETWKNQLVSTPFSDRLKELEKVLSDSHSGPVVVAEGITATNEVELLVYYEQCLSKGLEGVMIKDFAATYAFKRSTNVMKLKPLSSWDVVVVDVLPAREGTKWDGMHTILLVQLPGGGQTRVGTGFSDDDREYLNIHRRALVGRACEVQGQPPLTDDRKIRFPRFMRWREDWDTSPEVRKLINEIKTV